MNTQQYPTTIQENTTPLEQIIQESRTNRLTTFNDEWKHWIWSSVHNGAPKTEIFNFLLKRGWTYESIKKELSFHPNYTHPYYKDLSQVENIKQFDSNKVELYTIDDFISTQECKQIIALTQDNFIASKIAADNNGNNTKKSPARTSSSCHITSIHNAQTRNLLVNIHKKIARTINQDIKNSEPLQLQRYKVSQEYKPHCDFFEPGAGYQEHVIESPLGQRTYTFMLYLNSPQEGGETFFPVINQAFKPQPGRAVIWNNLHRHGAMNHNTLHAGTPVIQGEKYIITAWFRENAPA